MDERVFPSPLAGIECEFERGSEPWELWHQWALADGVPEEIADLGRRVIQHAADKSFLRPMRVD